MRSVEEPATEQDDGGTLSGFAVFRRAARIALAVWVGISAMLIIARAADLATRLALGYSPGL